jgi:hypothetical protein
VPAPVPDLHGTGRPEQEEEKTMMLAEMLKFLAAQFVIWSVVAATLKAAGL